MRSAVKQLSAPAVDAGLLTTGEAAAILGVSRQHVVNLCNRGDLPSTSTGTHRRVRRADIEALRSTNARMSRDQRRSLWIGHAVAGRLVLDPGGVLSTARENLARSRERHVRGQAAHRLAEWAVLLDGPMEPILTALTSPTPHARELRQNSPFAGVLTPEETARLRESFGVHGAGWTAWGSE